MSRHPHDPTKVNRELVSLHSTMGTDQATIADLLGIDEKTLRKHYRRELDLSTAKANATIGGVLYNKAKAGDTASMIFWLKTRGRWRETMQVQQEITNPDGSLKPSAADMQAAVLAALAKKHDA